MSTIPISFPFSVSFRHNGLPNADLQLATRIKKGRCTPADEARLNTLLASQEGNPFFENPAVQRKLVKGVLDGTLTDQRIVDRLKDCAVCLTQDDQIDLIRSRTRVIIHPSPERCAEIGFVLRFFCAEQQVALRVLNTQLRLPEESVDVVQTTTPTMESISSDRPQEKQESPAFETIANRMFGTAMAIWNVCDAYFRQGEVLDHAQLAEAILYENDNQTERQQFETLLASDEERAAFFNDSAVQVMIVEALHERQKIDPDMLLAIAQHLASFSDPAAQQKIAGAIYCRKFGTDTAVLLTIAEHLSIFTDSEAQRTIAWAIYECHFGSDSAVLRTLAYHLGLFTDSEAQRAIAWAIEDGKFGVDSGVLQALAQYLPIFTDTYAQRVIAKAIQNGQFGTDPDVLNAILKTIPQLLALLDTQTIIHLVSGSTLSVAEKIEALREKKFSLDLSATKLGIPKEDLPNLFGAKAYLGSEIKTLLPPHFPDATEYGIASVCEDNVEYAIQIHHQQLILYPLRSRQDQDDFIGWMHPESGVFYKQCVTNIKIYDFAQLHDGYPTLLATGENLSPAHNLFATLPAYLQQAIRDNSFDINQFRYANVIRFVTETLMAPLVARDAGLANKMLAIMQSSIVAQGDYITIAHTPEEDVALKDQMNALCDTEDIRTRSTTAVDRFLASLTPADKRTVLPRLAVLLGTMAKKKVLGYYHGEINQANTLLYLLASHCFHELEGTAGISFPLNFHQNLNKGICIESLTNSFVIANRVVFSDVFAMH